MPTPSPLSSHDDATAQAELGPDLFPHYVLGRNLAMEEILRELWRALPARKRDEIADRLTQTADAEMVIVNAEAAEGVEDVKRHVTRCGFVHTLLIPPAI